MSKLVEGLKGRTYLGYRTGFERFGVGKELQLIATQEVVASSNNDDFPELQFRQYGNDFKSGKDGKNGAYPKTLNEYNL